MKYIISSLYVCMVKNIIYMYFVATLCILLLQNINYRLGEVLVKVGFIDIYICSGYPLSTLPKVFINNET